MSLQNVHPCRPCYHDARLFTGLERRSCVPRSLTAGEGAQGNITALSKVTPHRRGHCSCKEHALDRHENQVATSRSIANLLGLSRLTKKYSTPSFRSPRNIRGHYQGSGSLRVSSLPSCSSPSKRASFGHCAAAALAWTWLTWHDISMVPCRW